MTAVERRAAFRRTRRTAAVVGAAVGLTFLLTDAGAAAPAQDGFDNGTGSAIALGYKANPTNGNLSFGITFGESVSGHQNTAATGQARAINLGVIGVTLAGEGCDGGEATYPEEDQPQPVVARSGQKGAEEGFRESEQGVIDKFARATTAPFAEAITEIAPTGDPAAAFISGGRTVSTSGIVDGSVREAVARTEIDGLSLGGGAVKLRGLTWEAVHRSGGEQVERGTFSIDGIEVGGQKIPVDGSSVQQLEGLKDVIEPLGFSITPPRVRVEQGIVFVDPLVVAVIPSQARDSVTGPLIGEAQPVRDAVTEFLLEQDCGNASYITIGDIALGGVSGAGQVGLEVGGVQATTSDLDGFQFQLPPALPPLTDVPGSVATPSLDTPAAPAADTPADTGEAAGDDAPPEIATAPVSALSGERGGVMAAIAGGGLLTLLVTAEGDRRKMRAAQRAIPLEA